jgi:bifunctional enzyme CysN/CysC
VTLGKSVPSIFTVRAYLLDGDNLRHGLSDDLGFSPRAIGPKPSGGRTSHPVAGRRRGGVLASLVSPLQSDREIARTLNDAAKLPFVVYVATSLPECENRDPRDATRGHARAI